MLNLVQIQDKLKDMPTRAIMAYANGQNPMVPPYLALGELNRRKQMEQSAMGEQARQGGEPPTIKQATEEQLGLMQLQKGRAIQAQQNMGQAMASVPSPVPAGVGEEPVQMAGGGLARLPVRNFRRQDYACGGIVAFQNGGETNEDMQQFDQATALYEAEREAKNAKQASGLSDLEKYELMRAKRGLDVAPETGKGLEALRKQTEMYKEPVYKDWTEGLLGTVQDIRSGQAIGSSRAAKEKENKQLLSDLSLKIATAEDLKAKADYEFKSGNFDKAVEYDRKAKEIENQTITALAAKQNAAANTMQAQASKDRVAIEYGVREDTRLMNLYDKIYATNIKAAQNKITGQPLTEEQTDAIAKRSMEQAKEAALQFYGKPVKGADVRKYDKDGNPIKDGKPI